MTGWLGVRENQLRTNVQKLTSCTDLELSLGSARLATVWDPQEHYFESSLSYERLCGFFVSFFLFHWDGSLRNQSVLRMNVCPTRLRNSPN